MLKNIEKNKIKFLQTVIFIIFAVLLFFVAGRMVLAASDDLLFGGQQTQVGQNIGLGDTDPRIMIANVIRIALGFLGVIAVILIMYAGWLYMTAGGEEDKIEQAKKILIGAVIGLAIILASFGIATFVLNKLYESTGGNNIIINPPNPCPSYLCDDGSGHCYACDDATILHSDFIPPNNSVDYPMNTIGSVNFNKNVIQNTGTFDAGGKDLQFSFVGNKKIEFSNKKTCAVIGAQNNIIVPLGWSDKFCFDPADQYQVAVSGYKSTDGNLDLTCGMDGSACRSSFKVKAEFDIASPAINIWQKRAMCASSSIQVSVDASDNYGISEIIVSVKNQSGVEIFYSTSTPAKILKRYSENFDLSSVIKTNGDYNITVIAKDIAGNSSEKKMALTVWPSHCCNFELDGTGDSDLLNPAKPETGVDCGGECGACEGGACAIDKTKACTGGLSNNCATNLCSNALLCNCEDNNGSTPSNCTLAGYLDLNGDPYSTTDFSKCCICRAWPEIENVTPAGGGVCVDGNGYSGNPMKACFASTDCDTGNICNLLFLKDIPNGSAGTMVTISGNNFGNEPGSAYFCKTKTNRECSDWIKAGLASSVNEKCVYSWSEEEIIIVAPSGAVEGPIKIETAKGYVEFTNDNWGKYISDFWVNNFQRPGICKIENPKPSGNACTTDNDCAPYKCLGSGTNKTCSKTQGYFEELLNYDGLNLANSTKAYFGDFYGTNMEAVANTSLFSGQTGTAGIPSITDGKTTTYAVNNNLLSNNLIFYKVGEPDNGPKILFFDPTIGTKNTYITIHGQGFGRPIPEQIGVNYKVFFDTDLSNNNFNDELTLGISGSFDFPRECKTEGLWRDGSILVKAPDLSNGNYYIILKVDNWTKLIDSGQIDETINGYKKQFDYQNDYPLAPGLCALRPWNGQRNDSLSLFGEGFGAPATHQAMFGSLALDNFTYSSYNGADKIATNVPASAFDGKNAVRVIKKTDTGCSDTIKCDKGLNCYQGKCRVIGNSLNFNVGFCANNNECSNGSFCCDSGPSKGKCESGVTQEKACDKIFGSCVYAFDISTGSTTSPIIPDIESCISYGAKECGYNYCPNSPGWCSYNSSVSSEITNNCDNNYCDSLVASSTIYNLSINRCVDGNICDLSQIATTTIANQIYNIEKYCSTYNNQPLFHYKITGGTCEIAQSKFGGAITDWINIGNNICVKKNDSCALCSAALKCFDNGGGNHQGICAYDKKVCIDGYACQEGKCQKNSAPCCECCCDINRNTDSGNPGCCAPLKCGDDCGSGFKDYNNNGSLDSGEADFGSCMGCTVKNDDGSINIEASDNTCNCSTNKISGKFCETGGAGGKGVCRDCASLQKQTGDCTTHGTCCVDYKNENKCRGSVGGKITESGINYCGYYDCDAAGSGNICLNNLIKNGKYKTKDDCDQQCSRAGGTRLGAECKKIIDKQLVCSYDICPDLYCLDENGQELACDGDGNCAPCADGTCGNCCCDPAKQGSDSSNPSSYDKCKDFNTILACKPNQTPCSGDKRGLCCGCTKDTDCSPSAPSNVGCSDDGCCRARPKVQSYFPAALSTGVCRNTLIQAVFDQRMDEASLSSSIYVVGDYGADTCPSNTTYLTLENGQFKKDGLLARAYKRFLYSINKIVKPIFGKDAFAVNNYCAAEGVITSFDNTLDAAKKTTVNFSPKYLLAENKPFYVIIKGDKELNSANGVLSFYGVGMDEGVVGGETDTTVFNGQDYVNSKIWKFTTGATLCNFDYVDVVPDNFVFKLDENEDTVVGKKQAFMALAKTYQNGGAPIVATVEYDWNWKWSIDNNTIINFANNSAALDPDTIESFSQPIEAQNQIDAATYLHAEATIDHAPAALSGLIGTKESGQELVRVFACKNPWPPIVNGGWIPWKDTSLCKEGACPNTNYEIYYCRDSKNTGTADDLPAILSDSINIKGASPTLKESYFFREVLPNNVNLISATSLSEGKKIELQWSFTPSAGQILANYKIYYGEQTGRYAKNIIVSPDANQYIVEGLTNGKKYYFAVTAIYSTGAESKYSNESTATPGDTLKPAAIDIGKVKLATSSPDILNIKWDSSDYVDKNEILNFKASYGVSPVCNGQSFNANNKNGVYDLAIDSLKSGIEYCFSFQAVDLSGNISDAIFKNIIFKFNK